MALVIPLAQLNLAEWIRPGDRICWGQASAEPQSLTEKLVAQRSAIGSCEAFVGISWAPTVSAATSDHIRFTSYCAAGNNRTVAAAGKLDILPIHYSTLPHVLERSVDVLLLQLPAPNADGSFSIGTGLEYLAPLIDSARLVIAEVNDQTPQTNGERAIHMAEIDILVHTSRPLLAAPVAASAAMDQAIAANVLPLIEDGAVLQIGLGGLPGQIISGLSQHRDLGVHSGLITDSIVELIESGVITNARKEIDRGVTVTGLLAGTDRLYRHTHRNPAISLRSTAYTHAADVIARLDRFTSINSAIEVDLTGQVNAEMAAGRYVGAVGGAVDFIRGAHLSKGGLPIIALPSVARKGDRIVSRIVANLTGPVSTSRADAGIIVTEFGAADLRGLSLRQRRERMLGIAAPQFRETLERDLA
ncbi:acetyl-CoA hydrolase/transferase family protein [Xanthobacteraceae bacterium A53D]